MGKKVRVSKKRLKRYLTMQGHVRVEGNNGGDVFEITDNSDGTVSIFSGSCCVTDIRKTVPVELLTGIMHGVIMEHNGDINSIIDSFNWSKDYKDSLKKKVSDY